MIDLEAAKSLLRAREQELRKSENVIGEPELIQSLGRFTYRARAVYNGSQMTGICKFYSARMGDSWMRAMFKQVQILDFLDMKGLSSGKIFDVRLFNDEEGQEIGLVFKEEINGTSIRQESDPIPLDRVQYAAGKLFDQLANVSNDSVLISERIAFCGDLSAGNVVMAEEGCITDWDSCFGLTQMPDVTSGYVAREVIDETLVFSEVAADTFGLASVLARALLGKETFRELVPYTKVDEFPQLSESERNKMFLTCEMVKSLLPSSVHAFFEIALSEKPEDRLLSGSTNPLEHYTGLKQMFGAGSV